MYDSLLRGPIEIDHHVPEKDDIHFLRKTEIGVHKIQAAKFHQLPQFGDDAQQLAIGITAAHEILFAQVRGHGTDYIAVKNSSMRLGQHRGRNIGGQHFEAQAGVRLAAMMQDHRQGVRLLAGRAASAPDEKAVTAVAAGDQVWNRLLQQIIEVFRLAKKIRLIACSVFDPGDRGSICHQGRERRGSDHRVQHHRVQDS
ncbi:MAG: hypothetical protein WCD47_17695 [Candidatus Sulfotelmatobacter sp.]